MGNIAIGPSYQIIFPYSFRCSGSGLATRGRRNRAGPDRPLYVEPSLSKN